MHRPVFIVSGCLHGGRPLSYEMNKRRLIPTLSLSRITPCSIPSFHGVSCCGEQIRRDVFLSPSGEQRRREVILPASVFM